MNFKLSIFALFLSGLSFSVNSIHAAAAAPEDDDAYIDASLAAGVEAMHIADGPASDDDEAIQIPTLADLLAEAHDPNAEEAAAAAAPAQAVNPLNTFFINADRACLIIGDISADCPVFYAHYIKRGWVEDNAIRAALFLAIAPKSKHYRTLVAETRRGGTIQRLLHCIAYAEKMASFLHAWYGQNLYALDDATGNLVPKQQRPPLRLIFDQRGNMLRGEAHLFPEDYPPQAPAQPVAQPAVSAPANPRAFFVGF